MKKIMLPLLAIILLLSGGAGAYFYMGQAGASTGEPAKAEKKAEGGHGEKTGTAYVAMQPIVLPIIDRDGITQTISLVVSLEVKDGSKVTEVEEKLPKLADAYLSDMYGTLSKHAAMENGVIKVSQLKARLVSITKRVMGGDVVDSVLLQVLQQHPT